MRRHDAQDTSCFLLTTADRLPQPGSMKVDDHRPTWPDHVNMSRHMIVRIDHEPQAFVAQNGRHTTILPETQALCPGVRMHPAQANRIATVPATASRIAVSRTGVSRSPSRIANSAANTTLVSRSAAPIAIGAWLQTHRISR